MAADFHGWGELCVFHGEGFAGDDELADLLDDGDGGVDAIDGGGDFVVVGWDQGRRVSTFARRAQEGRDYDSILEGDFLRAGDGWSIEALLDMQAESRDGIEGDETARLARALVDVLPRDPETMQRQLRQGYELACKMSWECVVRDYFLPALGRAAT